MISTSLIFVVSLNCIYNGIIASKATDFRQHLSSCTPYRFMSNRNDSPITYPDCREVKIWMIIRHGTRLPSAKEISAARNLIDIKYEIIHQHKKGRGQLNKVQLNELKDWTHHMQEEQEKSLTLEGQEEMVLLAERMQKRFPNIIIDTYDNETFLFRHTTTQRTHQSARYFSIGLFDKKESQNVVLAPPMTVDKVLRFYKHCDRWQKHVKKNPESYKEQQLYAISKEMNETLKSVSKRLGLSKILPLDTANLMYKICGYETAWYKGHTSPWCHAFDDKTIQVFEYYYDLKTYWLDGYGHELTYRQACVSIRHMLDSFRNEDGPRATFLFTHLGAILKLITYLGLYKPDSPLTGTHFVRDSRWKTSNIGCFASNLAFVLIRCKGIDYVLTLHQENIVRLPMCSEDLCPLHTILKYFEESIKQCDYDDMCRLDSNNNIKNFVEINSNLVS